MSQISRNNTENCLNIEEGQKAKGILGKNNFLLQSKDKEKRLFKRCRILCR